MPDYAASCVAVLALFVQGHCVRHDQTELRQAHGTDRFRVASHPAAIPDEQVYELATHVQVPT